ncbi:MAG: hypothetical protein WCP60_01900 [bacterium]
MIYPFTQSWLPEPEIGFHAGSVEILCNDGVLLFKAELQQPLVSTLATAHQQRLWELGDVVEFFVQKTGDSDYHEYQIAPNGMMLALHYPDSNSVISVRNGERRMEEYLCCLPTGNAAITHSGWRASLSIPVAGHKMRLNCGRYDCSMGLPAIISSTSNLTQRDFHRQQDWREFIPMAG